MLTGKRILVVEDEFLIGMEIVAALKDGEAGDVEYVTTQTEALLAIGRRVWDAAVVDVNLTGNDSRRVVRALRERGTPFLLVTGYGVSDLPEELAKAPLLPKPFRASQLVAALEGLSLSVRGG